MRPRHHDPGYKSGLEEAIGAQLAGMGITGTYEALVIPFVQPLKPRKYTPDYYLPNGIVIESKGRFVTADRQKHKLIREQYPDLDLRFVFSNPNTRISKQSRTTYAVWCESLGLLYAKGAIPYAWLNEPVNHKSLALIRRLPRTR